MPLSKFMPLWVCWAATEGWSAIQGREETGTEAFWWCNWQQMWRKMEIKEKEFKIISVWACFGGLSWTARDHVVTFVSLIRCCSSAFIFTVAWALEVWCLSAAAVVMLWKDIAVSLKEASNKTFLSPPDRSAHSAITEDKLDMLIFEAHCELLVNIIINPTHFCEPQHQPGGGFLLESFLGLETIQDKSYSLMLNSWQRKATKEGQEATFSCLPCGLTIRRWEQQGRAE